MPQLRIPTIKTPEGFNPEENKRRWDILLIEKYIELNRIKFNTKEQRTKFFKRNLKIANKLLDEFSKEDIKYMLNELYESETKPWSLEKVAYYLEKRKESEERFKAIYGNQHL